VLQLGQRDTWSEINRVLCHAGDRTYSRQNSLVIMGHLHGCLSTREHFYDACPLMNQQTTEMLSVCDRTGIQVLRSDEQKYMRLNITYMYLSFYKHE